MGADNTTDSSVMSDARSQISVHSASKNSSSTLSSPKSFQRIELLNYMNASGEELVGLVVELAEDPSGGVQVRVLRDSNVITCVSVDSLKECAAAASQQCDCCD